MNRTIGIVLITLAIAAPVAFLCGRQSGPLRDADVPSDFPHTDLSSFDVDNKMDENHPGVVDRRKPRKIDVTALFARETVEQIRRKPKLCAELFDRFQRLPTLHEPGWMGELTPSERGAVFCCILSYAMAPYDTSLAREFKELLQEKQLDCDNYVLLTRHFFEVLRRERPLPELEFMFVGWDGSAVGNHAQMFIQHADRSFLLDPTICLIARCDFDSVAAGKPVPLNDIVDFSWRKKLFWYGEKVANALRKGRYRPSDLFYYYTDFERYVRGPNSYERYDTPGAVRVRERVRQAAAKKPTKSALRN